MLGLDLLQEQMSSFRSATSHGSSPQTVPVSEAGPHPLVESNEQPALAPVHIKAQPSVLQWSLACSSKMSHLLLLCLLGHWLSLWMIFLLKMGTSSNMIPSKALLWKGFHSPPPVLTWVLSHLLQPPCCKRNPFG